MTTPPDPDGRDEGTPGPDPEPRAPLDVDSTFAAIVAHWADEDDESRPWQAQEDLGLRVEHTPDAPTAADGAAADGALAGDDPTATGPANAAGPAPASGPAAADPAASRVIRPALPDPFTLPPAPVEAELEERFVPPDPGPLPRGDLFSKLAWAGVLGGPLFLLLAAMIWREAPQLYVLMAVGAFIGGFVALVLRLPEHHDDDNDDGAVV